MVWGWVVVSGSSKTVFVTKTRSLMTTKRTTYKCHITCLIVPRRSSKSCLHIKGVGACKRGSESVIRSKTLIEPQKVKVIGCRSFVDDVRETHGEGSLETLGLP